MASLHLAVVGQINQNERVSVRGDKGFRRSFGVLGLLGVGAFEFGRILKSSAGGRGNLRLTGTGLVESSLNLRGTGQGCGCGRRFTSRRFSCGLGLGLSRAAGCQRNSKQGDPGFQSASAPAMISMSSVVIAAWRLRLYWMVSLLISSPALRVALSIAVIEAPCSEASRSKSAPNSCVFT